MWTCSQETCVKYCCPVDLGWGTSKGNLACTPCHAAVTVMRAVQGRPCVMRTCGYDYTMTAR